MGFYEESYAIICRCLQLLPYLELGALVLASDAFVSSESVSNVTRLVVLVLFADDGGGAQGLKVGPPPFQGIAPLSPFPPGILSGD